MCENTSLEITHTALPSLVFLYLTVFIQYTISHFEISFILYLIQFNFQLLLEF